MDLIEVLPSGLHEMILEERRLRTSAPISCRETAAQPAAPADVSEDDADRGVLAAQP
jgi:hypothetical protein